MKTKNIICFGFGQVAKNFIKKLNDEDIPFKLTTTSREESTNKKFENFANSTSIIWQQIETDFWKTFLKENLNEFLKETNSVVAKEILDDFEVELKKFKQICPVEMLDKLDNPITLKSTIKKVS